MDATSIEIGRLITKAVQDARDARQPVLIAQATEFGTLKFNAGYLTALNDVLRWLEEINLEDQKGSPFGRAA